MATMTSAKVFAEVKEEAARVTVTRIVTGKQIGRAHV